MLRYQIFIRILNILPTLLVLVALRRSRWSFAIAMTRGASYLIALAIVSQRSKKGVARIVGTTTTCDSPTQIFLSTQRPIESIY